MMRGQCHTVIFYGWTLLLLCSVGFSTCRPHSTPKPYGYFRIYIPDTAYVHYAPEGYPYAFSLSKNAYVATPKGHSEDYWIDIVYPALNTTVYCSYKPIRNNLGALSRDAQELLYQHTSVASAIPEQGFENPNAHVWGVYYELYGNAATPIQFYLTDSIHHFFRASVYCNTVPNQDSLAPVYQYIQQDMRHLVESFVWQK